MNRLLNRSDMSPDVFYEAFVEARDGRMSSFANALGTGRFAPVVGEVVGQGGMVCASLFHFSAQAVSDLHGSLRRSGSGMGMDGAAIQIGKRPQFFARDADTATRLLALAAWAVHHSSEPAAGEDRSGPNAGIADLARTVEESNRLFDVYSRTIEYARGSDSPFEENDHKAVLGIAANVLRWGGEAGVYVAWMKAYAVSHPQAWETPEHMTAAEQLLRLSTAGTQGEASPKKAMDAIVYDQSCAHLVQWFNETHALWWRGMKEDLNAGQYASADVKAVVQLVHVAAVDLMGEVLQQQASALKLDDPNTHVLSLSGLSPEKGGFTLRRLHEKLTAGVETESFNPDGPVNWTWLCQEARVAGPEAGLLRMVMDECCLRVLATYKAVDAALSSPVALYQIPDRKVHPGMLGLLKTVCQRSDWREYISDPNGITSIFSGVPEGHYGALERVALEHGYEKSPFITAWQEYDRKNFPEAYKTLPPSDPDEVPKALKAMLELPAGWEANTPDNQALWVRFLSKAQFRKVEWRGNSVDTWYDSGTRSYVTQRKDVDGNPVENSAGGDVAQYSGSNTSGGFEHLRALKWLHAEGCKWDMQQGQQAVPPVETQTRGRRM